MVTDKIKAGDKRDFNEIYDEVGKSPEFKAFEEPRIPVARRYTDQAANAIDRSVGAPLDEDKTTAEKVLTGGVQALIPTSFINTATKNLPAAGRWGVDLLAPGTSHFTRGGVAANAGIGAAITTGADAYFGNENNPEEAIPPTTSEMPVAPPLPPQRPVVLDSHDADETSTKLAEIATTHPLMQQVGLAAIAFGAAVGGKQAAKTAAKTAAKQSAQDIFAQTVKNAEKSGGAFSAGGVPHEGPDVKKPRRASITNELAPGRQLMTQLTDDRRAADAAVNSWSQHMRSNATNAVEAWKTQGIMENMPEGVMSEKRMRMLEDQFHRNDELQGFNDWMIQRSVLERRDNALKKAEYDLYLNTEAQRVAMTEKNFNKLQKLQDKKHDINARIQAHKNDLESHRGPMSLIPTDQMRRIVNAGNENPRWVKAAHEVFEKLAEQQLRFGSRSGLIEKNMAGTLRDLHTKHVFLQDDKHGGGTPLARFKSKVQSKFLTHDNPFGDDAQYAASMFPMKASKLPTLHPVNTPVNPFDAASRSTENLIRHHYRNQFKKNVIADLLAAQESAIKAGRAGAAEAIETFTNNGKTTFSPAQIKKLTRKQVVDPTKWVDVLENGRIKLYRFPNHPYMHSMLAQAPSVTVPIVRGFNRFWRMSTTGSGNLGFLERNLLMETKGFNAKRPHGSLYGADYLVHRGASMLPQKLQDVLAPIRTPVLTAVRAGIPAAIDPIPYAMNLVNGIHLWATQNNAWIARAITDGLAMDEGFFAAMAKNPAGRKYLEAIAMNSAKAFEDSFAATMFHSRAVDLAVMRNMHGRGREMDSFFNARMPRWARYLASPMYVGVQQYRFFVNSMQEAAKVAYGYRNWEALRDPKTGKVSAADAKKLFADIRTTSSGDLVVLPGNPVMQGVASTFPFTNVVLRSAGSMVQRLRDPRVQALFVSGVILPKLYSEYAMNHWDAAAADYYNNEMPTWKRAAFYTIPSPETIFRTQVLREKVPFSKDAIWEIQVLPDFRPYTEAILQAVKGLGLLGPQRDALSPQSLGSSLESIGTGLKECVRSCFSITAECCGCCERCQL